MPTFSRVPFPVYGVLNPERPHSQETAFLKSGGPCPVVQPVKHLPMQDSLVDWLRWQGSIHRAFSLLCHPEHPLYLFTQDAHLVLTQAPPLRRR